MIKTITFFRNFIGLFLLVTLLPLSAGAQTIILSENFASANAPVSNNTETNGSSVAWDGNENFVVDPVNSKAFQAGGAIKLGNGNNPGFITSVPLDLSQGGGNFTVSFDVKGWTNVEGDIKITVTGLPEQIVTYTATRTSATFDARTVTFSGGTANSTIRIETTEKRAFIDNVVVTTVPPAIIAAPVATAATNITTGSFTANWNAVTGATGYRLDVSTVADFSSFIGVYNDFAVAGTSQAVTGLISNTVYYFRVRAIDATSTSVNSNVIEAVTLCGPFTIPALTTGEYCPGATVADLPLATTGGYQWFATEEGGTALPATQALVSGMYYIMQTVNSCDSDRVQYAVNVIIVEAPIYAEPEIEVCNSGTIATITPEDSTYQFYTTPTGGTALAATTALINEGVYYVSRTVNGCESTRTEIMVELETPPTPVGAAMQSFTAGQTLEDLVVTADEQLIWFADEALTTPLEMSQALVNNVTYYAVNDDAGCLSEPLAVTVNNPLGTSAFDIAGLVTFPNPVNDILTVSSMEAIDGVVVYNMVGQTVLTANTNSTSLQVDMSGLAVGAYFVKVNAGTQIKTIRIVKQ